MRFFESERELAHALEVLSAQPGCESATLLVQDLVPAHLELRTYVLRGQRAHTVYTTFGVEPPESAFGGRPRGSWGVRRDSFGQKVRAQDREAHGGGKEG